MKYRLLDILCCPDCLKNLQLSIYETERRDRKAYVINRVPCRSWCGLNQCLPQRITAQECQVCYSTEITEGKLSCPNCGRHYPIVKGIPRLLQETLLRESILQEYGFGDIEVAPRQGASSSWIAKAGVCACMIPQTRGLERTLSCPGMYANMTC